MTRNLAFWLCLSLLSACHASRTMPRDTCESLDQGACETAPDCTSHASCQAHHPVETGGSTRETDSSHHCTRLDSRDCGGQRDCKWDGDACHEFHVEAVECPETSEEARALEIDCRGQQPACTYDDGIVMCTPPPCRGIRPQWSDYRWSWRPEYEGGCPRSDQALNAPCDAPETLECTDACGTGLWRCLEGHWEMIEQPSRPQ